MSRHKITLLSINTRANKKTLLLFLCSSFLLASLSVHPKTIAISDALEAFFQQEKLGTQDAVILTSEQGKTVLFDWQPDKQLVSASLVKLVTAYMAIDKWGLDKRFETDFFRDHHTLWVKGYGDPFLVSEELGVIAKALHDKKLDWVQRIAIDATHFSDQRVPGRSNVADPYNAPLSAVAANFNTAKLSKQNDRFMSAEPQTPITHTAISAAKQLGRPKNGETERINLINADNAARNFGELLVKKLALNNRDVVVVTEPVPKRAALFYRHSNSRTISDMLRGTLEYSNNFMANQIFLMLLGEPQASFDGASKAVLAKLKGVFSWESLILVEGSGLSRANRLTANQLNDLLSALAPNKNLFKRYDSKVKGVSVRAKTGTLNGVHSFAGYITIGESEYQFVFNFNRKVPYKYREELLEKLVRQLSQR